MLCGLLYTFRTNVELSLIIMNQTSEKSKSVPSQEYTKTYYESACDGFDLFRQSSGKLIPARLSIPLQFANIQPGTRVIDIGCGRGEVLYHAALRGGQVWGIDYASEAVTIANETLRKILPETMQNQVNIHQGDATTLSFPSNTIDYIFLLDVVEHLYPDALEKTFQEIYRVLKPGGEVIVHTMPNLWYYHYGYPLYRLVQFLRGNRLPANPRDRWPFSHLHVNEQSPLGLKRTVQKAGFNSKVSLIPTQDFSHETNRLVRLGMRFVNRIYPFKWIFCNDIFVIGKKVAGENGR